MWFSWLSKIPFRVIIRWFLPILVLILCEPETHNLMTCTIHKDAKLFGLIEAEIVEVQVTKDKAIECIENNEYVPPKPTPTPTKIPFDELNKPKE